MGWWKYEADDGVHLIWAGKAWHAVHTAARAGLTPAREASELKGVGWNVQGQLVADGARRLYSDYRGRTFRDGDVVHWQDPMGLGGEKHEGAVVGLVVGGRIEIRMEDGSISREIKGCVEAGPWPS